MDFGNRFKESKGLLQQYDYEKYDKKMRNKDEQQRLYDKIQNLKFENDNSQSFFPSYEDEEFKKKIFLKAEFHKNRGNENRMNNKNKFNLTNNQIFLKNFMSPNTPYNSILLFHNVGVGKCHAMNSPILMFNGKQKMVQDIQVNDLLFGDDFKPRTVLSLANGYDEMFQIRCENKDKFTVNSEHILCLRSVSNVEYIEEITVKQYLGLFDDQKKKK